MPKCLSMSMFGQSKDYVGQSKDYEGASALRRAGLSMLRRAGLGAVLIVAASLTLSDGQAGGGLQAAEAAEPMAGKVVVLPLIDPARGRRLFIAKGCIICHSVAGVGGKAAPAMDADPEARSVDVLDFAARMWRGAPAMLDLQAVELGYQIELSAEEIAHLSGFAADAEAQAGFSREEIPEPMRDWMLDRPYWEEEGWPDELPDDFPDLQEWGDQ